MNKITAQISFYEDHIQRNELWLETARKLYELKMLIKTYEKEESKTMASLKALSGGMSSKAGEFIFTKSMRKGGVDYKKIPELQGVDLGLYRKVETETWKLEPILVPFD